LRDSSLGRKTPGYGVVNSERVSPRAILTSRLTPTCFSIDAGRSRAFSGSRASTIPITCSCARPPTSRCRQPENWGGDEKRGTTRWAPRRSSSIARCPSTPQCLLTKSTPARQTAGTCFLAHRLQMCHPRTATGLEGGSLCPADRYGTRALVTCECDPPPSASPLERSVQTVVVVIGRRQPANRPRATPHRSASLATPAAAERTSCSVLTVHTSALSCSSVGERSATSRRHRRLWNGVRPHG